MRMCLRVQRVEPELGSTRLCAPGPDLPKCGSDCGWDGRGRAGLRGLWLSGISQIDRYTHTHTIYGEGGGLDFGAVNFAWEISHFKLVAKPTRQNFPHTSGMLWTPVGGGAGSLRVPDVVAGFPVNCPTVRV